MNIRIRLAFNFTLVVTLILLVFSVTVYQFYGLYRETNYLLRLKEKSFFNAKLILDDEHYTSNPYHPGNQLPFYDLEEESFCIYTIRNENLGCIGKIAEIPEKKINLIRRLRDFDSFSNDTQYVGIEIRHKTGEYIVYASGYDRNGFTKLRLLYRLVLIMLSGSILLAGFAGWWYATVSLRPMQEVMREVGNITATNLHQRVKNRNTRDEIDQLVNTFNQMLERIENSFIVQKTLVASASHEYRTPLTAIKGQIEVALLQPRNEEQYRNLIQSIHEEINKLIRLQESLSELIKATSEKAITKPGQIPLLEVVADARTTLLKSKPEYKISFIVSDIPLIQEESMIWGDDSLLKSAFTNLMDNGCKFSRDKSVQVSMEYTAAEIITRFKDNGPGIHEKDMENIFTPFYRSNEVRDIYGHGLGLALVQRIIQLHEGSITVESEHGKGTTFCVRFKNVLQTPNQA